MTNQVEVYFALKGDKFDPDEFTQASGLVPTEVFRKGTPRRHGSGSYTFGMWKISAGRKESDVLLIGEIAEGLIGQLENHAEAIANAVAAQSLYTVLEVVLHISMNEDISTPALGFSSKAIAFLHTVGAEIDVDIYRGERAPPDKAEPTP